MNQKAKHTTTKAKKRTATIKQIEYVLPLGNGWVVKNSAAAKFLVITDNKKEAVSIARNIAKRKHTELIVYNKDGKIHERISYAAG